MLLDKKGHVARAYRIRGTPAHFLIDKTGTIIAYAVGAKNWEDKKNHSLIQYLLDESGEE